MNANDARITRLFVTQTNGVVQDDSPNAPATGVGSPAGNFDLHLQMEAGSSVAGGYQLIITAYDVTTGDNNAALDPPAGPLNGPANFAVAPWVVSLGDRIFDQKATITVPTGAAAVPNHVFYYTAALRSDNFQIVSFMQSDFFILV
jgi:hypothetical protein